MEDNHALQHQVDDLSMKIDAILEYLEIKLDIQPKSYTVTKETPEEEAAEEE